MGSHDNEADRRAYSELRTNNAAALHELVSELHAVSNHEPLTLEKGSVWGTAVALPQIARSADWNSTFVMLAVRVYLNYALCITLSLGLLTYIGEETHVMNPLGGQMHLCDFGANLYNCPEGEHCLGPGGTKFTKTRLYGYTQWAVQRFVKQSLLDIMPDKQDAINQKVDPGEYGIENYWCRLSAVALFIMSMVPDIESLFFYLRFFWQIPTAPASWIQYSQPEEKDAKGGPWERIKFQVAGIPLSWKFFYLFVLIIPRIMICHFVLQEGVQLLMETSGITDSVLSAVSMTFVADIGGMIFHCMAPRPVPPIMQHLEQPDSPKKSKDSTPRWVLIIPGKVVVLLAVGAVYVIAYYFEKCTVSEDGTWVSKDMYLPQSTEYSVQNLIFHNMEFAKEAFWSMPSETHD